jgi:hypothetical protein
LATPPSLLVKYIEMERWPIPRAFLDRFSSVPSSVVLAIFGHVSSDFSACSALLLAHPSSTYEIYYQILNQSSTFVCTATSTGTSNTCQNVVWSEHNDPDNVCSV